MYKALVLVRNLESRAQSLDFGEFTIHRVGVRFEELREIFKPSDVSRSDWIFERSYVQLPPGPLGTPFDGILEDIEDMLLLLRLYKRGDISFSKLTITLPSGDTRVQSPYRAMNDLNSYSSLRFNFDLEECDPWKTFAKGIQKSQSWNSGWFSVARRFFLSGGAKPFDPEDDDVDRIVDYATALEATLVPEKDYNTSRISHRAAALTSRDDPERGLTIAKLIKRFYGIRSQIVHGSGLSEKNRQWLSANCEEIELHVRQVLVAAVRNLPPAEGDRRHTLAKLYDPTDEDRKNFTLQKFAEIKTPEVRRSTAAKIAELAAE